MNVTIKRNPFSLTETTGELFIDGNENRFGVTLELPWLENEPDKSCIPSGIYKCEWNWSEHLQIFTYEILNVPNRSGVRIHSANYVDQLLGCIALGANFEDLNKDGVIDIIHSRDAINSFADIQKREPFELTITNSLTAANI